MLYLIYRLYINHSAVSDFENILIRKSIYDVWDEVHNRNIRSNFFQYNKTMVLMIRVKDIAVMIKVI